AFSHSLNIQLHSHTTHSLINGAVRILYLQATSQIQSSTKMFTKLSSLITLLLVFTPLAAPLVLRHRRQTNSTTNLTQPNTSYQPAYIPTENTGQDLSYG